MTSAAQDLERSLKRRSLPGVTRNRARAFGQGAVALQPPGWNTLGSSRFIQRRGCDHGQGVRITSARVLRFAANLLSGAWSRTSCLKELVACSSSAAFKCGVKVAAEASEVAAPKSFQLYEPLHAEVSCCAAAERRRADEVWKFLEAQSCCRMIRCERVPTSRPCACCFLSPGWLGRQSTAPRPS